MNLFLICLFSAVAFLSTHLSAEKCAPFVSQACRDYSGVMISEASRWEIDLKVYHTVKTLEHACDRHVSGVTAMNCYALVTREVEKCYNGSAPFILPPCRKTCEEMHKGLTQCKKTSGDSLVEGLCSGLPEENCVSTARQILAATVLVFVCVLVITFVV
jgi:hypothetical protein